MEENQENFNAHATSGDDLNAIRRVKFYRHGALGQSRLDFNLVINHRIQNYVLLEGQEYDLPQYVINHIASVKNTQYFSSAETGEERKIETPIYYCQLCD